MKYSGQALSVKPILLQNQYKIRVLQPIREGRNLQVQELRLVRPLLGQDMLALKLCELFIFIDLYLDMAVGKNSKIPARFWV